MKGEIMEEWRAAMMGRLEGTRGGETPGGGAGSSCTVVQLVPRQVPVMRQKGEASFSHK